MNNVILIGMPGAGKSTVGVVLAKALGYTFIDSDLVIQQQTGMLLHELISAHGVEGFWQIESEINSSLCVQQAVIATGGSVCYEPEAMKHLCQIGKVVYLKLSYEEIEERLGDLNARGVTMREGQNLMDLYQERTPLYEKYAHLIVDCDELKIRQIVKQIASLVTGERDHE